MNPLDPIRETRDNGPQRFERLREVTARLLDARRPAHALRPEVVDLAALLSGSSPASPVRRDDISRGEVRTANGLALSPTMAAMCADDYVRTIEFLRGTHAALIDLRRRIPDRPARVLYAGCGPNATLAIPLMTVFTPAEAVFTLIDLHPESVESVRGIAVALGVADRIASIEAMDAAAYRVRPGECPDLVLLEIMRACLEAEPQVAITRHLLGQAPDAILIPEEIRVDLVLVDPSREFDLDGSTREAGAVPRDRVEVASVFTVNRETVKSWTREPATRLDASAVKMPVAVETRYQPMLFMRIRVYRDHRLEDYDSGLTCPRSLSVDATFGPGDTIRFHYELGSHPRLVGEVCPRPPLPARAD